MPKWQSENKSCEREQEVGSSRPVRKNNCSFCASQEHTIWHAGIGTKVLFSEKTTVYSRELVLPSLHRRLSQSKQGLHSLLKQGFCTLLTDSAPCSIYTAFSTLLNLHRILHPAHRFCILLKKGFCILLN